MRAVVMSCLTPRVNICKNQKKKTKRTKNCEKTGLIKFLDRMKYLFFGIFFLNSLLCFTQSRNLDYFLQEASQNSPVVRDYQNQILIAQIDSQLLKASLRTQ